MFEPGESLLNADTGVWGLEELCPGGLEFVLMFEGAVEPELIIFSIWTLFSGLSWRVFFSLIWLDNFSNVISPVVWSIINTHSFCEESVQCPLKYKFKIILFSIVIFYSKLKFWREKLICNLFFKWGKVSRFGIKMKNVSF